MTDKQTVSIELTDEQVEQLTTHVREQRTRKADNMQDWLGYTPEELSDNREDLSADKSVAWLVSRALSEHN
ncbi:hypothetical protein BRC90_01325 [Halobacteriales archaeon QS_4_69_34]|nr:MAG: hypothetical protein BRC90_01325 [Halobacteriales archaeon QS_4_69_34]